MSVHEWPVRLLRTLMPSMHVPSVACALSRAASRHISVSRNIPNSFSTFQLECHQSVGSEINLYGSLAKDTYQVHSNRRNSITRCRLQIGSVLVPGVPFLLSNRTTHPLSSQWTSDGVMPLGLARFIGGGGAIQNVLDAVGGNQEVAVFLSK